MEKKFVVSSLEFGDNENNEDQAKLPAHRAGLPGNVNMITGSALTPLRESIAALPAPACRQEGRAASRLARDEDWGLRLPKEVRSQESVENEK